jgi:hypothetical protein
MTRSVEDDLVYGMVGIVWENLHKMYFYGEESANDFADENLLTKEKVGKFKVTSNGLN